MSDGAILTAALRRIRRRIRLWNALEGAVAGGALGLCGGAVALAVGHHRGVPAGPIQPLLLVGASAAAGALSRSVTRISLMRCARYADAALDGEDRVLSALSLSSDIEGPAPLARALVADAATRLRALAPGRAAPPRRPRAIPALLAGALALAVAALSPVRSGAALPPSRAVAGTPRRLLPAAAFDVEREQARAATEAARRLGDERLAELAGRLEATIGRLSSGTLGDGDALEALKTLEAQAAEAARAAERDRQALHAAEQALKKDAATRAAGEALASSGDGAAEQARAALGAGAEAHPAETGRALADASRGLAAAAGAGAEMAASDKPGPRRLARDGSDATSGNRDSGAGAKDERRLERLARDLDDTAAACKQGAPGCRTEAEKRARDLSQLARRAASAESLRRLERAAGQMRARLGRGELRAEADGADARRFQRAARGQGQGQERGEGQRQGQSAGEGRQPSAETDGETGSGSGAEADRGEGEGQTGKRSGGTRGVPSGGSESGDGEAATPESATLAEREGAANGASTPGGGGIGHEQGGAPLGRREGTGSHGRDAEARVADGAGPNRAAVIGVAAGRGFAGRDYAQVFSDYQAAVEDALGATAVPEGKRYIVRRYFDLIRPRAGGHRP